MASAAAPSKVVEMRSSTSSIVVPAGSAQEQALHQQALHQQALHQQSLHQHGLIPRRSMGVRSVKSEPVEAAAATSNEVKCTDSGREHVAGEQQSCDDKIEESEDGGSLLRDESGSISKDGVCTDLNAEPPTSDADDDGAEASKSQPDKKDRRRRPAREGSPGADDDVKKVQKPFKPRAKAKWCESGADGEKEYPGNVQNVKEEKIKSLKGGLVHVTRKIPRNAHAHFYLGLMYQRSNQPLKAISAFEKAEEILKQAEDDICQGRAQLLAKVQNQHAQCILQGHIGGELAPGKEIEKEKLHLISSQVKDAAHGAAVWNILGLLFLHTGRTQSAISVFTSLLTVTPESLDALANLGVAYLHKGDLENAARCFQSVLDKDLYYPGALLNYGALLLQQHGAALPGAGAGAGKDGYAKQASAADAACHYLQTALKEDPKAAPAWANLATAYQLRGDFTSASKCLEQASRLEPSRLSIRYAVAAHRIKDAERSDDPSEQMSWAANEMASILREGDSGVLQPRLAWAGLAMVNKAQHEQHESAASFTRTAVDAKEVEDRAVHTLQQAVEEDPEDAVKWHQLGLHTLSTLQFAAAQNFLKLAIARRQAFGLAWSNLGIALQLSDTTPTVAEAVYKRALSLMEPSQTHTVYSNLGNLYRQQKRFSESREAFNKALEICPNYAPACNNLGLLDVAEGKWEEGIAMFDKAYAADPYLDVAKSNRIKATALFQQESIAAKQAA